ncbi:TPA: hypothetical protein MDS18_004832, partial [Klebsiella pneumoniae]|nr:hypothetical protein [Klebsiella pneumoniae]
MTDISEESKWVETVPLITRGDKVSGGLNGVANKQALAIVSRTRWIKDQINGMQSGEMPYSSEAQAQEAINSGRLTEGNLIAIRSSDSKNWVDEYRVLSGAVQKTGKSLPAMEYIESIIKSMVVGFVSGWEGNTLYPFDEFLSPNENTLSLHAYAVNSIRYREACGSLQIPVATGDIITVRYKYSGKGGAPSVGLKTSINGTFVSNQVTLTASDNWQEIKLTATAATATLIAVGVNTRLATDIQLSIVAYSNKKNAITAAILAAMDGQASLTEKTKIG